MIYNSAQTIEKLSILAFDGCSIQEFLNAAEDILVNPLSFTPFKELNDSIYSKSFPRADLEGQSTEQVFKKREDYVMMRMSQLGEEPIVTEGGPGVPRGHILCWAMEKGQSYGLVCVAKTKIPLELIDKGLVVYISRCLAHIYAMQQRNKVKITPDEALDRLLSGQISSRFQLASSMPGYDSKPNSPYSLAVFRFSPGRTMQIGPYLRNQFKESLQDCWCTWNGKYFAALIDCSAHDMERSGKTIDILRRMSSCFKCPVCISPPYANLIDTKSNYERMISLPVYNAAAEPGLFYLEDHPECSLIFESRLDSAAISNLTSGLYKKMKSCDEKTNSAYVETLKTYVNCGFNVSKAAEKLFIHSNSVLYRLNRMEELFGLDTNNADAIFAFMFSVRLENYM